MKRYQLVVLVKFLSLNIIFSQKSFSQPTYTPKIDTLSIGEGVIVNKSITPILDSALTFLRLPPLESGLPYCYILSFTQVSLDNRLGDFYEIKISVNENSDFQIDPDFFNKKNKFFFTYKGMQIMVFLSEEDRDNDILYRYIKPTSSKGKYFNYYKNYSDKTYVLSGKERSTTQEVRFTLDIRDSRFVFRDYKLEISGSEWIKARW